MDRQVLIAALIEIERRRADLNADGILCQDEIDQIAQSLAPWELRPRASRRASGTPSQAQTRRGSSTFAQGECGAYYAPCSVLRKQSKTEHKAERLVKKVDARFKAQASASLAPGEWGAMTWIDRYVWMD